MKQGLSFVLFGLLTACGGNKSDNQDKKLVQALDQAKAQNEALAQDHNQELTQVQDKNQELVQALDKAIIQKKSLVQDHAQALAQLTKQNQSLVEERDQALAKIKAQIQALDQSKVLTQVHDLALTRVKSQNHLLVQERDQALVQFEAKNHELVQVRSLNQDLSRELDQEKAKNSDLVKNNGRELAEVRTKNQELDKQLDQEKARIIDLVKNHGRELAEVRTKNQELDKQLDQEKARIIELVKNHGRELAEVGTKNQKLNKELDQEKSKVSDLVKNHGRELAEVRTKNQELDKQLDQEKARIIELVKNHGRELAEVRTKNQKLNKELDQEKSKVSNLIKNHGRELAEVRTKNQELNKEVKRVKSQNITLVRNHNQALIKVETQNQELVRSLSQVKAKNKELVEALNQANALVQEQASVQGQAQNTNDYTVDVGSSFLEEPCENNISNNLVLHGSQERIEGYPYYSAHLVIYKLNFNDRDLNWPDLNKDLCKVKDYYKQQSYGQFELSWEIKTVKLEESTNQFFRSETYPKLEELIHNVVRQHGIDPKDPGGNRIVMIALPQIGGYSSIGRHSFMSIFDIQGDAGVIAHEMAHAMGLKHSRALEGGERVMPFSEDPNDRYTCSNYQLYDRRSRCESERKKILEDYGNIYSMMGLCSNSLEEFNLLYKKFFNWLDLDRDVPLTQTSGRYRFFAYDQGKKYKKPIGLRLTSGNGKYVYWLEHKTHGRYASNSTQGILINLEGYANNTKDHRHWKTTSYLLDMTPGSVGQRANGWWGDDQADSALAVGQSYTDHWGGFEITVLQVGGPQNTPEAWVDVDVRIL